MEGNALGMMEELHAEDEHEESSYLHVLEEFEAKQDEDHVLVCFQRYYEILLGGCCTILEEVHDHTLVESISSLMDEYCIELVYRYSSHTSISATSCGDENWVKEFFLLMPHEEHETPILLDEGFMVKTCGLTSSLVVFGLFPLEPFSMEVCSSIEWIARHMIEMCALEGKHIA